MSVYVPNYYKDFACIADACKHNCCIGWEIDIDKDTYAYYKSVPGAFGARLNSSICAGETPHFALGEGERCPFLNGQGLCDIITELGEDKLCQICSDHPRYRNYLPDRTEMGLGLCCEAAAKLILTREEKTEMVLYSGEEITWDIPFITLRAQMLEILQDRSQSMRERVGSYYKQLRMMVPYKPLEQWCAFYLTLEQLDAAWTTRLQNARETAYRPNDLMLEQLICYFIFRHLAGGERDKLYFERMAFAVHATRFICALSTSDEDFLEVARMYSAEIEYSEENMQAVLSVM